MTEYFTEALVLDKMENKEADGTVVFYSFNLGKVSAKARSLKKITSKLSAHLEPLNFVNVRLIEKNGFQVADALTVNRQPELRNDPDVLAKFLRIIQFIKTATFELQPDQQLYSAIKKIMFAKYDERQIYRLLLKILGFDPEFATCHFCNNEKTEYFLKEDGIFLCRQCGGSKIKENEIVLV
ncbi:MAG: DNA repair protein RecO [Patescibacteria group bacterium]